MTADGRRTSADLIEELKEEATRCVRTGILVAYPTGADPNDWDIVWNEYDDVTVRQEWETLAELNEKIADGWEPIGIVGLLRRVNRDGTIDSGLAGSTVFARPFPEYQLAPVVRQNLDEWFEDYCLGLGMELEVDFQFRRPEEN